MTNQDGVVRRTFLGRLASLGAALTGVAVLRSDVGAQPASPPAPAPGRGISVKSFGAVGNNIADDTAAIQAAIDYAASHRQSVVYLPAGTYKISAPAAHPGYALALADATTLVGDGLDITIIHHVGASNAIRMVGTAKAQVVKTSLRDLSVFGDGQLSKTGLQLSYAPYGFYQNIRIREFNLGVSVDNSWCLSFEQVTAEASRQDGWSFGRDANNVGMKNCVGLQNARAGYYVAGARSLVLMDCNAEENASGVIIAAGSDLGTEKVSILGGYYEGNKAEEVSVRSDGGGIKPKAITIRDAYFVRVDNARHARGVAIRVREVTTLVIEGCCFSQRGDGYTHSLYLQDSGAVAGVVWGAGNLDESASGRFKGAGMAYSVAGATPG